MTVDLITSLWVATALMLVIEGIMPFINPKLYRQALLKMANMPDQSLRIIGLFSMAFGVILLYWIH